MEEVLENFQLWRKLVLISTIKKEVTAREIARVTNESHTHPYFRKALIFLEKNNFCLIRKEQIPYKYKIKYKELAEFLRQGEPFLLSEELIKLTRIAYTY